LLHPTSDAFADLQRLVSPGEHVALFAASPLDVPGDWLVKPHRSSGRSTESGRHGLWQERAGLGGSGEF